jgi:hypothetical protein
MRMREGDEDVTRREGCLLYPHLLIKSTAVSLIDERRRLRSILSQCGEEVTDVSVPSECLDCSMRHDERRSGVV